MATLAELEQVSREPIQTVFETQSVMQMALGRELSESGAMVLGFELLEFLGALTGDDDGSRESC